ncbi:MAG: hypothetical protein ACYDC7_07980 [Acidithiobacillus ferrivorans]
MRLKHRMEAPTLTSNQQAALHRIQVRPILPTERERWNTLMQAHQRPVTSPQTPE